MPDSNPRNARVVREINRRDILLAVARMPRSNRLFVGSSEAKLFDLDAGQANPPAQEFVGHDTYVTGARLAGNTLISGSYDGTLKWWNLENRQCIRTVPAHERWIRKIGISPDGAKLVSVADDMVVRIWNAATGERLHELRGHAERTPQNFRNQLYACVFSADNSKLATGDRTGIVKIWDAASGRDLATVSAPTLYTWDGVQRIRSIGGVRSLAFSPNGQQLAVGGIGQIGNVDALQGPARVEIFDWEPGRRIHEFTGPQALVNHLEYHPQGNWLFAAAGANNGPLMFYDVGRRAMIHQMNLPMHIHECVFDEDRTTLFAVGHNKIAVVEMRA